MNRKELAARVTEVLCENGVRKIAPPQKTVFHVTDDDGGKKDFVVKKEGSALRYTVDDIYTILEAVVEVVIDTIRRGEKISILGFGTLYLKRRAARVAPHPMTGEVIHMKEHFVVKFDCGKNLKMAASAYHATNEEMQKRASDILTRNTSYVLEEDVIEDVRD